MDKKRFAKRSEIRPHILARWGQLTERDLERIQGNAEMLIEMRLGRLVEPPSPETPIEP